MTTVVSDIPIPSKIAHLLADPEVARWIRDFRDEQRAQAWDEGAADMRNSHPSWWRLIPNPYRQEDAK